MTTSLLKLAERCEGLTGLLVGEATAKVLREARSLVWPQPAARVPTRPDGSPWPGDGLGPYTEEYKEWGRITEAFEAMVRAGAFESAALMLVPGRPWRVCTLSDYPHNNFQSGAGWFVNLSNDVCGYERCGPVTTVTARAATPALALCAAALRALDAVGGDRG